MALIIKKKKENETMEKLDPYPLLMQMWNNAVTLGNTLPVSQKLKNKSTT